MENFVVYKFGGSSVRDAKSMERSCSIVLKHRPRAVVVSATYNTTNELELLFDHVGKSSRNDFDKLLEKIILKHLLILDHLRFSKKRSEFKEFLYPLLDEIEKIFVSKDTSRAALDVFYSLGEMMSSWIFYTLLSQSIEDTKWIDSREWLKTDNSHGQARPQIDQININVAQLNEQYPSLWVTQGFIGATMDSKVTTLGREGSDYSATLLGQAFSAKEVVIWTDVDGVYTADPRIVSDARKIPFLSYAQAELLAESGAKVLYSRTLAPAKRSRFRVRVASSIDPDSEGSLISENEYSDLFAVTKKSYNQTEDLLTVLFTPVILSSIEAQFNNFKTHKKTDCLWQAFVPSSRSEKLLKDFHAALISSCV